MAYSGRRVNHLTLAAPESGRQIVQVAISLMGLCGGRAGRACHRSAHASRLPACPDMDLYFILIDTMDVYLESQWPVITGYFGSFMGYFME